MAVSTLPTREHRVRRAARWTAVGPYVLGVAGILTALLAWELYSAFGPVSQHHLPPPSVVIPTFLTNFIFTAFWLTVGQTMWAWFLGLTIATLGGLAVGLLIGSSSFLRAATHTTVEFLRPIPAVGLIPLAALLFGPRIGAELLIVVYGCFWIVMIQVMYGITDIDKVADDTVRTLRMTWLQRVRHLVLPTLLPYLMTGIRLAATVALILAISSELIVGTPGIGRAVAQAQLNDNPPAMIALILTSGLLGILVNLIFRFIERKLLFWHSSVRSEVAA
ncbi:ABC transporter permease [Paenarthrobacter ureafaciens]|uniref:ABC transporter permease n=1 Tax=Paenarthrobacter ureafaciens TaxID=37931 RepID=UPI002DB7DCBE|nr:ABC transporter permease [Paenarthrobacter ureafaciens]MEC3851701.1 ABC transporter permease [Paenarthrobacter ureafaciens]